MYKQIAKERIAKTILLVAVALVIVVVSLIPYQSRARSQGFLSLVNSPKLTEQFTEDNIAGTPLILTRVFHNKVVSAGLGILSRYATYFDPEFLFVQTTSGVERHTTPDMGLLYLIEGPLFLLGLLYLFTVLKKEKKYVYSLRKKARINFRQFLPFFEHIKIRCRTTGAQKI